MNIPPNNTQLYEEACRYKELGDTYNAVKLFKRLVKIAPGWFPPYLALGDIYFKRREWKPCFHYNKKAVALTPDNRDAWWMLSIAGTALKKKRLTKSIWAKFGLKKILKKPEGLRLTYADMFEILWMLPLSPAEARILSIPHPASGFKFRDLVLYNRKPIGHHIVDTKRVPVYAELGVLKKSPYETFSCLLHTNDEAVLFRLEELCQQANLGFEIWSNAARGMVIDNPKAFPEYYGQSLLKNSKTQDLPEQSLVAIAAIHQAEVQRVLNNWQIITLAEYSDLRAY